MQKKNKVTRSLLGGMKVVFRGRNFVIYFEVAIAVPILVYWLLSQ